MTSNRNAARQPVTPPAVLQLQHTARELITAWYGRHHDSEDTELAAERDELIAQSVQRPELAALFTNQVMCDAICELSRTRDGILPLSVPKLYAVLGNALAERPTGDTRPRQLVALQGGSTVLLQGLASHMLHKRLAVISRVQAADVLSATCRGLSSGRQDEGGEGLVDGLLTSSSALTTDDAITLRFVHPCVHAYFGAIQLADEENLELLVERAHEPEWHDVVLVAAVRLHRPAFADLIRELVKRAGKDPAHASTLDALAEACVSAQAWVLPELAELVQARAALHARELRQQPRWHEGHNAPLEDSSLPQKVQQLADRIRAQAEARRPAQISEPPAQAREQESNTRQSPRTTAERHAHEQAAVQQPSRHHPGR